MSRFIIAPQARRDLDEIWEYVAQDNLQAANKLLQQIDAAIRLVARLPGTGHERSDVRTPNLLFRSVGSYVIAYRPHPQPINVVRVVHGRRDFQKLFRRRD